MPNKDNIIVGSASVKINGEDAGYTTGGVSFRKDTEYVDVDADQVAGVIQKIATFERAFVSFTMLEVQFANMQRVMNEPTSNLSGSQLTFGSAKPTAAEYELQITGPGPSGKIRTYTFWRAISVEGIDHMIGSREAPSSIPVGFELLKDPAHNNAFGFAVDTP